MVTVMLVSVLLSGGATLFFGHRFGVRGSGCLSLVLMSLASGSALIGVMEVSQTACLVTLVWGHWFEVGSVSVCWSVSFADPMLGVNGYHGQLASSSLFSGVQRW